MQDESKDEAVIRDDRTCNVGMQDKNIFVGTGFAQFGI